jgi:hypothetical protein
VTVETTNVRITAATLGYEDHGILTSYVKWEANSMGGGFGGFILTVPETVSIWVRAILDVFGVDDWSRIKGQLARVRLNGGTTVALGHIIEDRWVTLDELRTAMQAAEARLA